MNELDDELAVATDTLLKRGDYPALSENNSDLGDVLLQLYGVIEPNKPLSSSFEARLTRSLETEWERAHAPTLRLLDRPILRIAGLAAAVVLVLGAVLVLSVPDSSQPLQGMAFGVSDGVALLVLAGVTVVAAVYNRRKRH